jgi:hypothetical protein
MDQLNWQPSSNFDLCDFNQCLECISNESYEYSVVFDLEDFKADVEERCGDMDEQMLKRFNSLCDASLIDKVYYYACSVDEYTSSMYIVQYTNGVYVMVMIGANLHGIQEGVNGYVIFCDDGQRFWDKHMDDDHKKALKQYSVYTQKVQSRVPTQIVELNEDIEYLPACSHEFYRSKLANACITSIEDGDMEFFDQFKQKMNNYHKLFNDQCITMDRMQYEINEVEQGVKDKITNRKRKRDTTSEFLQQFKKQKC